MTQLNALVLGAVAMASFTAGMFFVRFWCQTRDRLFLAFAVAFGIDASTRVALATAAIAGEENEPLIYIGRLISFLVILGAIVDKNWRRMPET
jgi:pimeloyl-ACP methyl ester carboxylesterase